MRRSRLTVWLSILTLPLVGWLILAAIGYGVLLRYDPMAASESDPAFIQDAACIYASGIRTVTVFSLGNAKDAECPRLYKIGSLPQCPGPLVWPVVCEEGPDH